MILLAKPDSETRIPSIFQYTHVDMLPRAAGQVVRLQKRS